LALITACALALVCASRAAAAPDAAAAIEQDQPALDAILKRYHVHRAG
jgi:hypothetical protein